MKLLWPYTSVSLVKLYITAFYNHLLLVQSSHFILWIFSVYYFFIYIFSKSLSAHRTITNKIQPSHDNIYIITTEEENLQCRCWNSGFILLWRPMLRSDVMLDTGRWAVWLASAGSQLPSQANCPALAWNSGQNWNVTRVFRVTQAGHRQGRADSWWACGLSLCSGSNLHNSRTELRLQFSPTASTHSVIWCYITNLD